MITIFTPTFNRRAYLQKLFASLCDQTDLDFEWLIVDDGSLDGTQELVRTFDCGGAFPIRYFHKKNEGKHIAWNLAVNEAHGEYFFCVDSDDFLPPNAIATIKLRLSEIADNDRFAGVAGLRSTPDGRCLSPLTPEVAALPYVDCTYLEYRIKRKIKGDNAEVIRMDVLRRYPFPKFEGENFLSEGVIWCAMAEDGYLFRWFNETVYVGEYLEDGLTRRIRALNVRNSRGKAHFENLKSGLKSLAMTRRFRYAKNYSRFCAYAGYSYLKTLRESRCPLGTVLALPFFFFTKLCPRV